MSWVLTIPLSVVSEFLSLTRPPEGEEFGLINACDMDWTQADLKWFDKRGDMSRLPRFLELAEQINLALQQINPDEMIADTCAYGTLNSGLDAVGAFLALHEYGLIVDDTSAIAPLHRDIGVVFGVDFLLHQSKPCELSACCKTLMFLLVQVGYLQSPILEY